MVFDFTLAMHQPQYTSQLGSTTLMCLIASPKKGRAGLRITRPTRPFLFLPCAYIAALPRLITLL